MVNSKMRILWSVRQGHCLIASGSPSQQTGRHRVDTGICGISIGANRHIHSFVPHGLWSIHYVPVLWSLRGGLITEGWSDPEDLLEEEDWNKGKERPEGHRWRRGLECPELPYKMLCVHFLGLPSQASFLPSPVSRRAIWFSRFLLGSEVGQDLFLEKFKKFCRRREWGRWPLPASPFCFLSQLVYWKEVYLGCASSSPGMAKRALNQESETGFKFWFHLQLSVWPWAGCFLPWT